MLYAISEFLILCDYSHHPDPNLTYAEHLVERMYSKTEHIAFGAAWDGDGVSKLTKHSRSI